MYVFTSSMEVPAEQAQDFEGRFIEHLCNIFPDVPGLASAELEYPQGQDSRHTVVLEFASEADCAAFGTAEEFAAVFSAGLWEQSGAWSA